MDFFEKDSFSTEENKNGNLQTVANQDQVLIGISGFNTSSIGT